MKFKNAAKYFGHIDQQISCAGRKLSSGYGDMEIDFSWINDAIIPSFWPAASWRPPPWPSLWCPWRSWMPRTRGQGPGPWCPREVAASSSGARTPGWAWPRGRRGAGGGAEARPRQLSRPHPGQDGYMKHDSDVRCHEMSVSVNRSFWWSFNYQIKSSSVRNYFLVMVIILNFFCKLLHLFKMMTVPHDGRWHGDKLKPGEF